MTGDSAGGIGELDGQTDYEKVRRLPFLFLANSLTSAATLGLVGAPLTLFATELGFKADRIGLLGGIMPFVQVLGVLFLPLIMHFGCKRVAASALFSRYLFLLLFLVAPMFANDQNIAFLLLFMAMVLFSLSRTIAEAAYVPWSQEFMPRSIRGRVTGRMALVQLPVALAVSFLIKLWLDNNSGLERFYPVFLVSIVLGLIGAASLFGLGGGRPRAGSARGLKSIGALKTPLRDKNFMLFLASSGTQYLVFLVVSLFLVLFFKTNLPIPSGQLIFMSAFISVGGALGSFFAGWLTDRLGARGVRITLQAGQAIVLLAVPLVSGDLPNLEWIVGLVFLAFGFLIGGSITAGNVYMLNYVPPSLKESYLALAYSMDGVIGGSATFGAGFLLFWLNTHPLSLSGWTPGAYQTLFVLCAIIITASALIFAFLREEGATGVREFLSQFYSGNSLRVIWGIASYASKTSEERRRDLTYRFGGANSSLAKEELFEALRDPSFDVRFEAIEALGHLPKSQKVIKALQGMANYEGLGELQYAALSALGRLKSKSSITLISRFLDSPQPLLRARAIRSLGEIGDRSALPVIRAMLEPKVDIDCRLAAVSALGKLGDEQSIDSLLDLYCELVTDISLVDEPRSKVVLLAVAKILNCEASFAQEWRREEKLPGSRLPALAGRLAPWLAASKSGLSSPKTNLAELSGNLGAGKMDMAFAALHSLKGLTEASPHQQAHSVVKLLDRTREIENPHPALLVLLFLALSSVLKG